jgi:hypothetical protein
MLRVVAERDESNRGRCEHGADAPNARQPLGLEPAGSCSQEWRIGNLVLVGGQISAGEHGPVGRDGDIKSEAIAVVSSVVASQ